MEKLMSRLTTIAIIGIALVMANCKSDDDKKASVPILTLGQSTLNIKQDSTKTFQVQISASGGIKHITATTESGKGTVAIPDSTSVLGKTVGTVQVSYTAPDVVEASDNITITVTDNLKQQATASVAVNITANPPIEIAGTASAAAGAPAGYKSYHISQATTWGPNRTYHVTSDIIIDAGASLTVQSGTTVIVDGPYTIEVKGNFYSYGTAQDSVVFTVPPQQRTKANIFGGLWGGILSSNYDPSDNPSTGTYSSNHVYTTDEMVALYTRIEFVGLLGSQLGYEVTDILTINEVTATAPVYALFFNNPTGKFVLQNSTIAYTKDVAVQVDQGKVLMNNNLFVLNGINGGESIDVKGGTVGDIAYNVFYKTATNAIKWNDKPARANGTDLRIYNNTIVQSGWRQSSQSDHGGSLDAETGGRGMIYNNLIVSSSKGVRFVSGSKAPDIANLKVGYDYYYGNDTLSVSSFYPTNGTITAGSYETNKDVAGAIGTNDPKFVNFTANTFDDNAAQAALQATDVDLYIIPYDFHLQSGSPALTGGNTTFSPYNTTALSAGGKTFPSPAPASYIGAFGSN